MIGRRCKARERLSRAPLIGRALRDHSRSPPLPTVLKGNPSSSAVRPPGRLERHPRPSSPRRNAPRGPAALAAGAHPDPYRTRKLSRPAPMVLQGRPCGRLGRRRPPGRVARARGGEARERHLGRGTREGPPFRLRAFPEPRKEERPPTSPCGSAGGLLRSGASRPRRVVPDGGPPVAAWGCPSVFDAAPSRRRRRDPTGRSRAFAFGGCPAASPMSDCPCGRRRRWPLGGALCWCSLRSRHRHILSFV